MPAFARQLKAVPTALLHCDHWTLHHCSNGSVFCIVLQVTNFQPLYYTMAFSRQLVNRRLSHDSVAVCRFVLHALHTHYG